MDEDNDFRVWCECCYKMCMIKKDSKRHVILCCPFCGSQRVEVTRFDAQVEKPEAKAAK